MTGRRAFPADLPTERIHMHIFDPTPRVNTQSRSECELPVWRARVALGHDRVRWITLQC